MVHFEDQRVAIAKAGDERTAYSQRKNHKYPKISLPISTSLIGMALGYQLLGPGPSTTVLGGGIGWYAGQHPKLLLHDADLDIQDYMMLALGSAAFLIAPRQQQAFYFFGGLVLGYLTFKRNPLASLTDTDPILRTP